ncbi:MAG TPA: hypothetical protein PK336_03210, partial [Methanoculleus sp.]|nr:hypothetical protein [Methanoculleus sp.]
PAPPPAPSRGRAVNGDWPGGRARRGNRIFGGFSPTLWLTLCRARHLWDIAPVGEGLTGRGRNAPSPVSTCY